MRARFAAADALLKVGTSVAIQDALERFMSVLQLDRSDTLGVRHIIPGLLLQLDRVQECYDFLKWWAIVGRNRDYDWSDTTQPFLNIRNADVFEPIDIFCSKGTSLGHLVILTLVKLSLYLDLGAYQSHSGSFGSSFEEIDRPIGRLARSKIGILGMGISKKVKALERQYEKLCRVVHDANPHFWPALVDEGAETLTPPSSYSRGDKDEANLVLYQCRPAWQEIEDAILMVNADTASFAPVYESPTGITRTRNARPSGTDSLEKRRGTGKVFPSTFKPPVPTSSPLELFPAGRGQSARFVSLNNTRKVLVYVDGACPNNGQPEPLGGWAAVYGPGNIVSSGLESTGPFGDHNRATSNRAELRATIAALRMCDWRGEGYDSIIIATDSVYVVDGATGWAKSWTRNNWKTRTGGDVKNKDLWELLLGEVERWRERGLDVALWRIPRELNALADTAAKQAAQMEAVAEFRDIVIGSPSTPAAGAGGTTPSPHVLTLCLEYEALFDKIYQSLTSRITAKARMERATTPEAALSILDREPPPSVILVVDGGLARQRKVWERVIDHLRGGATVLLAACFSSSVSSGEFNRFFATIGLPWQQGSYHRSTVTLRRNAVGGSLSSQLPSAYSQKALFVKNVEESAVWYAETGFSDEAAAVFATVGLGKLGYVGDVNGEEGSDAVVLAMCGLLD